MACANDTFEDDLAELTSAEEFLDYFGIDFSTCRVVQVNRLHILQRFHDYLAKQEAGKAPDYVAYRHWLARAYADFVGSSAQAEKVFAVFQKAEGSSFVPLSSLTD
jgi:nitrogenase-stabilizing/protective protein